jgi:hypothetical protein
LDPTLNVDCVSCDICKRNYDIIILCFQLAAETERVVIDDVTSSPSADVVAEEEVDATTGNIGLSPQPSPSFQAGKSKGIKKIFGR